MRHLDDGQIAELIDSADRRTGGPADRGIEEHLNSCAACGERVEEARAIAERARAILGAAAPAVPDVPPFEEILHRAGRAGRSGARGSAWRKLAWAATVVVAGGVGWYARGELGLPGTTGATGARGTTGALDSRTQQEPAPVLAAAADARATDEVTAAPMPRADQDRSSIARTATPAPARPAETGVTEGRAANEREVVPATPPPARAAPPAEAPAPAARERLEVARALQDQAEPSAKALSGVATLTVRQEEDTPWIRTTRDQAEAALGGRLATVPGLPLTGELLLSPAGPTVRWTQRLTDGTALELSQSRTAAQVVRDAPTGQVRRYRSADSVAVDSVQVDGFLLVARGRLSADSLRALLERVRR